MSILKKLKFSNQTRAKAVASPEVRKREKLLVNIERQIQAAEADLKGKFATFTALRHVTHPETKERTRQSVSVKIKPWWWQDMSGIYFLSVKYGNKRLEFTAGNYAIEIGKQSSLIPTLKSLAECIKAGEMDDIIAGAAKFGALK